MTTCDDTSMHARRCCSAKAEPMASPSGERWAVMTTRLALWTLPFNSATILLEHIFHG